MDKAEFSGKQVSSRSIEDIPEALRDKPKAQKRSRQRLVLASMGLLGLSVVILGAGFWYISTKPLKNADVQPSPVVTSGVDNSQVKQEVKPLDSDSNSLLGHFAYTEVPAAELEPIVANGSIKLHKAAARQFKAMRQAARTAGVVLVPISGFRSVQDQQHLFFDIKAQRLQTATKRAEVSAPPGYSEHHTGYAVDIGDGAAPATNLNPNFEQTKAFQWLAANASRYNFELSFPKNNPQGVSYEPWHWRFVGDRDSLETFYKARDINKNR